MAEREFSVTLSSDIAERLAAGDDVSTYVSDAIRYQVRREAILGYLADCEAAGQPPLTSDDLDEFHKLIGLDVLTYHFVYDTPALVGHATGVSHRVRAALQLIIDEPEIRLRVPAICLLEAYAQATPEAQQLLGGLATNPGVLVAPVDPDPRVVVVIGRLAVETGRAGAAHAAHVAMEGEGPSVVFTDVPMPAEVLARPV